MSSKNENALLDSEIAVFDEEELSMEDLKTSLETELEIQFSELSLLEEEREKIGNPDNLGKVIMDEVWTQFGNQLGLDLTNETLIQAYNREHPETYKEVSDAIMNDDRYKVAREKMKQQQKDGTLVDAYTGKNLEGNDKWEAEHVDSKKEIFDNQRRRQAGIDTIDLANKEENLVPVNQSLNRSKQEKSVTEYIEKREQREKDLKKNAEAAHKKIDASNKSEVEKRIEHEKIDKRLQDKLNADDKLMKEADKKARAAINKDIAIGVTKQTAKKAGKDALKTMAIAALFDLLKTIMNGLIRFFKEKHKSFKTFLNEMKEAVKQFISHISSFVTTGVSSMVSTVLTEIFGPVISMFKKLASFIRQGISSFVEAVRYLTAKENKNKPLSIKIAQVGKIVTAGLAAAGAIVGSELIEKALLHIPVMAVEIPLLGSIANITGMFLASVLCGVVGAIVMNYIDRYIKNRQKNDNLDCQIDKKNEILQTQDKLIDIAIQNLSNTKEQASFSMMERRRQAEDMIGDAMATIYHEEDEGEACSEHLKNIGDELSKLLL